MVTVGIDISKSKTDVTVLLGDKKSRYKIFDTNQKGFKELAEWLTQARVTEAHVRAKTDAKEKMIKIIDQIEGNK